MSSRHGRAGSWAKLVGDLMVVVLLVLTACSTVLAAVDVMSLPPSHINVCPHAYLVEFKSEPGGIKAAQEADAFRAKIATMKGDVHIRQEFNMLINGISVQVKDPNKLREIMSWESVERVTPLTIVSPPEQVQPTQNPLVTSALNMTGVTRVHSELGIKGKGIKVGIIDTGIDYTHPALGGCFGEGCRVAYGYDFVGDAYTGKNTPVPSKIPMDCAGHGSHVAGIVGASDDIVMGVAPEVTLGSYRVLGCNGSSNDDVILAALERAAADKMDVINLSIGEPNGWPSNPVSRAIGKLATMGIMVTVSQGNENTQGLFSANYVGEGPSVMAVASIINTRVLLSYFTVPLLPDHRILYVKSDVPGLNTSIPMVAPLNRTKLGDGCQPFQQDLTGKVVVVLRGNCLFSLKAKHALDKGAVSILFVNNVKGSLVASVDPYKIPSGSISMDEGQKLFETLKANTRTAGASLTTEVVASFSVTPASFVNEAGGSVSVFSSYGLDNELHIKPDIGAPGENIFSTWPVRNGSYMTLSGTSMASPHLAGALALGLQHFRAVTGMSSMISWGQIQRIYDSFKITADPAYVFKNGAPFDALTGATVPTPGVQEQDPGKPLVMHGHAAINSVAKQGSGMVNIYRALSSLGHGFKPMGAATEGTGREGDTSPIGYTFVTPSSFELNDTEFAVPQPQMITIYNYGSQTIQYELSHLPAESLHEYDIESREIKLQNQALYNVTTPSQTNKDDVMSVQTAAKVIFSSRIVSVPAGGQRRVSVNIMPPDDLPVEQHWIYSGFIIVRAVSSDSRVAEGSSTSEAIHIKYAGVKGRMKTLPIFLRPTPAELAANNDTALCQVLGGAYAKTNFVYSFQGNDTPVLTFCIGNPTRFLILDLISGGNDDSDSQDTDGDDYEVLGRVASNDFVSRSLTSAIVSAVRWDGTLDLEEGGDNNSTKPIDGREIIHHEPGMDLIYGMRAKTGKSQNELSNSGGHMAQLIQKRGVVRTRTVGDAVDKEAKSRKSKGNKDDDDTDADAEDKKSRNKHLLAKNKASVSKFAVPDGRYRLRLRGLRMLGNIDNPDDYDVWITRPFEIQRVGAPSEDTLSTSSTSTTATK